MSVISLDSASTVNSEQASPKITVHFEISDKTPRTLFEIAKSAVEMP